MNKFDLLPTHNFRYGMHPQAALIGTETYGLLFDPGFDGCWKGCRD
jgi:aldehyde:ferredoxin oxidoreductase